MADTAEYVEGLQLTSLSQGSVVDLFTQNRGYRLEYLGGDRVRISGHPQLCPSPSLARVDGSQKPNGEITRGFITRNERLVFRLADREKPVVTSEIVDIRVRHEKLWDEGQQTQI